MSELEELREKVLEGLGRCTAYYTERHCPECPYYECGCQDKVMKDAMRLLRQDYTLLDGKGPAEEDEGKETEETEETDESLEPEQPSREEPESPLRQLPTNVTDKKKEPEESELVPYTEITTTPNRIFMKRAEPASPDRTPEDDEAVTQAVKELTERAAGNYGPRDNAAEQDTPENAAPVNDPVNHPGHYTTGKIEVIDFITDKELNFCRGNAVKYIVRAGLKDPEKEVEDLEKAVFYLNREIADVQARKKGAV